MNAKTHDIVEFLKANLRRKLTTDEIAQAVKLSQSRLCHLLKSETGMTLGQYLKMLRMEKAREHLRQTSLSIKEVMAQVGIQDKSHFTKDFKKAYGMTPSKYRERLASEKSPDVNSNETKQ